MSDPTATEALENITEYVRQRRQYAARGADPEAIHGVQWDPEGEMAELTVSDLEELLSYFSTTETEVAIQTPSANVYLQPHTTVKFWLSPDPRDVINVRATDDGLRILGALRALSVAPVVSNVVLVQVRP
jgi:hypothetical protein